MKHLLFLISVFFLFSCQSEEKDILEDNPDNTINITFTAGDKLVVDLKQFVPPVKGKVTSDSDLSKVKLIRTNGGNPSLIKEFTNFENSKEFVFDETIEMNATTSEIKVEVIDVNGNSSSEKLKIIDIESLNFSPSPVGVTKAFPDAEGHGCYTSGGRGGRVYHVTTLEDYDSEGSLRWALNQEGPRTIVFEVSGTIQLLENLKIKNGDVTIAGQTAPGDGICLRNYPVTVDADNVIIRFLRFRMGDTERQEGDALGGRYHKNIIIDHCSMSWSTDECASFYQNENFTMQWCIISESLRNSVHFKGSHGFGGIWGGKKASFHHNLMAHHDSRNPRLGETNGDAFAFTDLVDLRNNVIYNWHGNSCYGGEAMNVNIVNCYYKPGPATTKPSRIIAIDKETEEGFPTTGVWGKFYIDGNYMAGSTLATNDNWTYGVYNQFHSKYGTISETEKNNMRLDSPLDPGPVTTHSAQEAYELVLAKAGASISRDTVDARIVHDVKTGTATFMTGGNGSINGIIDTQSHVGGWPELKSVPPPTDSDRDGIPDEWELANGLDPMLISDGWEYDLSENYTNLEVYLNELVQL
ncbi:pectate lyase family protein [Thermophagus sp. OGC60D27]|uniref:pectate lyase family protein n=1 Tax=Thermophagus sp. OGC60D27 TaxID=3458415 RepID=UPI00403840F3